MVYLGIRNSVFPANIYCLFYVVDKLVERFIKKALHSLTLHWWNNRGDYINRSCFGMCDRKTLNVRRIAIEMEDLPKVLMD